MNKIITILVLAGLVFACKSKSDDVKPEEKPACKILSYREINSDGLKGAYETYIYDKTGKLIEFRKTSETTKYAYDSSGNLLRTIEYYIDNQGSEKKTFEIHYIYNVDNQLIRQEDNVVNYAGELKKTSETFYEYHANGKMKKKSTFRIELPIPDTIIEYNQKGKEILIQYRSGQYLKTEYNAADLIVKQTGYYADNNQTNEQTCEYNSQNLKVKSSTFTNGVLNAYETYEYNAKGKLIAQINYDGTGKIYFKYITEYTGESYKTSQYDAHNNVLWYSVNEVQNGLTMKWSGYQYNKLLQYIIYAYDSHKNMIKLELYDSKSVMASRQEWSYQCD